MVSSQPRKVSIIIPTRNSSATLRACLEGIRNQSFPSCEIIVVDNFSSDSTTDIVEEFGAKVIRHRGHRGSPASQRNVGVLNSSGKYVLLLDSDQVLESDLLRECVSICERESAEIVNIPEVFLGTNFWASCLAFWKNCYSLACEKRSGGKVGIPRFFLKSHMLSAGLQDENLHLGEDEDFYRRLQALGMKEAWCKSKIYHYDTLSFGEISTKYFRYGKTIPEVMATGRKEAYAPTKNTFPTFVEVLRGAPKSPLIAIGCLILWTVRTSSMMLGFLWSYIIQRREAS